MNPYDLTASISALAISMSESMSIDELVKYAAIFVQLGDTLATIAVYRELLEGNNETEEIIEI